MKTILIPIVLLFTLCGNLISQNEIHYGININPKLSTFNYEDNDISNGKTTVNYTIGGSFYLSLNDKIELSSGINVSRIAINQTDYTPLFGCDFNGMGADQFNSYIRDEFKIYYIGIPIDIKYKVGARNNVYIKTGGEVLLKQSENNESFIVECGAPERAVTGNPFSKVEDVLYKINLGFGYEFLIKENIFFIEPVVEYSLNDLFKEAGIVTDLTNNVKVLEFGIKLGVKI